MIKILLALLIGFLLLGILCFWFLRGNVSEHGAIDLSDAREAMARLQFMLLPVNMVDRIFDLNDWEFVRKEKEPAVLRLLQAERKTIAISWLRLTRQQVGTLMGAHVRAARRNAKLSPAIELRLAHDYYSFLMTYEVLLLLIWLGGPFRMRKMTRLITGSVAELCRASQPFLRQPETNGISVATASGYHHPGAR